MALIKCPECGNDVSSAAAICPICGYPLSKEISQGPVMVLEPKPTTPQKNAKAGKIILSCLSVFLCLLAFTLYMYHLSGGFSSILSLHFSSLSTYVSLISALLIPVLCVICAVTQQKKIAKVMIFVTLGITVFQFVFSVIYAINNWTGILNGTGIFRFFCALFNGEYLLTSIVIMIRGGYAFYWLYIFYSACYFAKNIIAIFAFNKISK